ncbi:hypothetical protein BH11MYX4_BH11MYX4_21230 [soil metagenome]
MALAKPAARRWLSVLLLGDVAQGWAPGQWRSEVHGQRVVREVLRTLA